MKSILRRKLIVASILISFFFLFATFVYGQEVFTFNGIKFGVSINDQNKKIVFKFIKSADMIIDYSVSG